MVVLEQSLASGSGQRRESRTQISDVQVKRSMAFGGEGEVLFGGIRHFDTSFEWDTSALGSVSVS